MFDEFEVEWLPEDTGAPYEMDMLQSDTPSHTVDEWCKEKYGHTNWARMGMMSPEELHGNPHEFDLTQGIIYFKNARMV